VIRLLDVNVLVALAWPNHIHHARAIGWFERVKGEGWATCPVTESGFLRVSSNSAVIPEARSVAEVRQLLSRIRAVEGHRFWADDVSPVAGDEGVFERAVGYRQVTDAHLLTLAIREGAMLATFDRALPELAGEENRRAVEVID